mmetsp:Transcript_117619/g.365596  ORF Transcript_117619/g.365596 Transcript_117619/m.365596 type:complete len:205 (-) Transcript_117619:962-1576(-)
MPGRAPRQLGPAGGALRPGALCAGAAPPVAATAEAGPRPGAAQRVLPADLLAARAPGVRPQERLELLPRHVDVLRVAIELHQGSVLLHILHNATGAEREIRAAGAPMPVGREAALRHLHLVALAHLPRGLRALGRRRGEWQVAPADVPRAPFRAAEGRAELRAEVLRELRRAPEEEGASRGGEAGQEQQVEKRPEAGRPALVDV